MTRRAAAVLLLLLMAAVGALVLLNRPSGTSRRPRFRLFLRVTPAPAAAVTAAPGATPPPGEIVRLTLFFPSADDARLRQEERDIPKPSGAGAFLRAIFTELHRGPTRAGLLAALPAKMQLRNAFLLPEGTAVLDLAMDASLSFGSEEELSIVAALVDSTLQNVADTTRVRILVNGEPAETLGGHVDLTRPLAYLRSEVAAEAAPAATPAVPPGR
ncbi:MAG: GerMN domain-containing protein [Acidobacteriota bacterium]|nr:GerMN domain-containing protein [Acidobacteriota bacterium]